MSKIGRKPISLKDLTVDIKGQEVHFKGKKSAGVYVLPPFIKPAMQDKMLTLTLSESQRGHKKFWGMHRALLANELIGASDGFEKKLQINGLGFKAIAAGSKVTFSLGFSHKIDLELPKEVTLEIDKTGQQLIFRSANKFLLGQVCDTVRSFRPPEPYKGTGIKLSTEVIIRKAGKTKSSA